MVFVLKLMCQSRAPKTELANAIKLEWTSITTFSDVPFDFCCGRSADILGHCPIVCTICIDDLCTFGHFSCCLHFCTAINCRLLTLTIDFIRDLLLIRFLNIYFFSLTRNNTKCAYITKTSPRLLVFTQNELFAELRVFPTTYVPHFVPIGN